MRNGGEGEGGGELEEGEGKEVKLEVKGEVGKGIERGGPKEESSCLHYFSSSYVYFSEDRS